MKNSKSLKLNKGEWAEIYCAFYLLENNKLILVNSNFEKIQNNIFLVKEIIKNNVRFFNINEKIIVINNDKKFIFKKQKILKILNEIIINIQNNKQTTFEIKEITEFLNSIKIDNLKSSSFNKDDISLHILDLWKNRNVWMKYSIKSNFLSPATLLNSSNKTNFLYKIKGLTVNQINEINSINTKTKLKDKIKRIKEFNGEIEFLKIEDEIFDYNLKMIDSLLPIKLANVLVESYLTSEKLLKNLFLNNFLYDENQAIKKLSDFLYDIAFGIFPGKKWDGNYIINGGIIFVLNNFDVVVLDNIYFENEIRKYLVNNIKLDSPSSSRYNVLKIYEKNNEFFFTLNLQLRFKN